MCARWRPLNSSTFNCGISTYRCGGAKKMRCSGALLKFWGALFLIFAHGPKTSLSARPTPPAPGAPAGGEENARKAYPAGQFGQQRLVHGLRFGEEGLKVLARGVELTPGVAGQPVGGRAGKFFELVDDPADAVPVLARVGG